MKIERVLLIMYISGDWFWQIICFFFSFFHCLCFIFHFLIIINDKCMLKISNVDLSFPFLLYYFNQRPFQHVIRLVLSSHRDFTGDHSIRKMALLSDPSAGGWLVVRGAGRGAGVNTPASPRPGTGQSGTRING